jgi:hypothetical protein
VSVKITEMDELGKIWIDVQDELGGPWHKEAVEIEVKKDCIIIIRYIDIAIAVVTDPCVKRQTGVTIK